MRKMMYVKYLYANKMLISKFRRNTIDSNEKKLTDMSHTLTSITHCAVIFTQFFTLWPNIRHHLAILFEIHESNCTCLCFHHRLFELHKCEYKSEQMAFIYSYMSSNYGVEKRNKFSIHNVTKP